MAQVQAQLNYNLSRYSVHSESRLQNTGHVVQQSCSSTYSSTYSSCTSMEVHIKLCKYTAAVQAHVVRSRTCCTAELVLVLVPVQSGAHRYKLYLDRYTMYCTAAATALLQQLYKYRCYVQVYRCNVYKYTAALHVVRSRTCCTAVCKHQCMWAPDAQVYLHMQSYKYFVVSSSCIRHLQRFVQVQVHSSQQQIG